MKNLNDNAILLQSISACNLCEANFGFKPRPVFQGASNAKIIIAGQAPGRIVHETGIPFNDASGDRLRDWLGLSKTVFYDESLVAILSMAFCYPGASSSGDKPPPAICAKTWRSEILKIFVEAELIIVVGKYAKDWHLPLLKSLTLIEVIHSIDAENDSIILLPHPSPRNNIWLSKNNWFEKDVIPVLKSRVLSVLN